MDTNELRRRMEESSDGFLRSSAYVPWEVVDGEGGIMHVIVEQIPFVPVFTDPADVARMLPNAVPRIMPVRTLVTDMPPELGIVYDPSRDDEVRHLLPAQVQELRDQLSSTSVTIEERRAAMSASGVDFLEQDAYIPVDDAGSVLTLTAPDGHEAVPVYADPTDIGRHGAGARQVPIRHLVLTMPPAWGILVEPDHDEWRRDINPDFAAVLRRVADGETVDDVVDEDGLRELRERMASGPAGFLESVAWVGVGEDGRIIRELDDDGTTIVAVFASEHDVTTRYSGQTASTGEVLARGRAEAWSMEHLVTVMPEGWAITLDPSRPSHVYCEPAYVDQLRALTDPFPPNVEVSVAPLPADTAPEVVRQVTDGVAALPGRLRMWVIAAQKRTFTRPQVLFVVDAHRDVVAEVGRVLQAADVPEDGPSAVVTTPSIAGAPRAFKKLLKQTPPVIDRR